MSVVLWLIQIITAAWCIYIVGQSFIDHFYDRKEEMMKRIIDNERGKF